MLNHYHTYGLHRPPLISGQSGDRVVVRGNELMHWAGSGSFINFLEDDLLFRIGHSLEKFPNHPLRIWLDNTRQQVKERKKINPEAGLLSTVAVMNFFTVANDLYVVSDNAMLRDRLLKSLSVPDQFHGARYELLVAACMIRGGFEIHFSDESDLTSSHSDAFARHKRTGAVYDVEMKARGRAGVLGKPGTKVEAEEMTGNVSRLLRGALEKPATRERLVFIDMNLPPKPEYEGPAKIWWVQDAVNSLTEVMNVRGNVPEDESAFVVFTNSPSNFMPPEATYEGLEIAYTAFNKNEFMRDMSDLGDRSPDIADLFDSFNIHSQFPDEFL